MKQSKFHRDIRNASDFPDYYSIRVVRPEEINDDQWKSFCELMDEENFEDKCLWDTVDKITTEVRGVPGTFG